jgi:hypothetical protein
MRPFDDPSCDSPDETRTELAAIFAAAILRLRVTFATEPEPSTFLEVPAEPVLSGPTG